MLKGGPWNTLINWERDLGCGPSRFNEDLVAGEKFTYDGS